MLKLQQQNAATATNNENAATVANQTTQETAINAANVKNGADNSMNEQDKLVPMTSSNPNDLKGGMSNHQRRVFTDKIHEYKNDNNIPPNGNVPWPVLVRLAEEARRSSGR